MSLKTQSAVLKEEPEKRVRIPGFANLIGCSVPKVRGLVRRREVDFFKIGRTILVPTREAERILRDGFRPRQTGESAEN